MTPGDFALGYTCPSHGETAPIGRLFEQCGRSELVRKFEAGARSVATIPDSFGDKGGHDESHFDDLQQPTAALMFGLFKLKRTGVVAVKNVAYLDCEKMCDQIMLIQ